MEYFGRFTEYTPDSFPEGMPQEMARRVVWLRNEEGEDLYELRKRLPSDRRFLTVEDNWDVRVVHDDPHAVWPANGGHLYAVAADFPMDPKVLFRKRFDPATGKLTDIPPPPVREVSAAQAKVALYRRGFYEQVEAAVSAMPFDVRLWFTEARVWERYNPYVMGIGIELGLTEEQIDELFQYASTLSQ